MEKATGVQLQDADDNLDKWVHDSTVDHKGGAPRRASTGAWKASVFIIAIEFSERLSYFGLATNLIIYLTKHLHYEVKAAVKMVNYWLGVTTLVPLAGGFLADAYLGRFASVLLSGFVYIGGLSLLTMSQIVPALKLAESMRLHEIVFFIAIYLISIGTGGHKPSLQSFGADQFENDHPRERRQKLSFFNWWNLGLCSGLLLGVTIIVYVEDNVGYGLAAIVLTSVMALSLVVFLLGRPFYRYRLPSGSPLTPLFRTLAAAVAKRRLLLPPTADELFEDKNGGKRLLSHTDSLRFFDKAAIRTENHHVATVTQVEELKLVIFMAPIWLLSLPFGICVAQASTFFIKQGSTMNRKLSSTFEIPPSFIFALAAVAMIVTVSFYDKFLVPFLRRATGIERGISILHRVGIGLALSILAMATAALVEQKRLSVAWAEKPAATLSMSVFWLVPQFVMSGFADGFTIVGLQEYFYEQMPDSMRSLGIALYLSVLGAGSFLSSLLITAVDQVTRKVGKQRSWFAKDLNESRLDLFYWLLAVINGVNLGVYVLVAKRYSYKGVQTRVGVADSPARRDGGAVAEP